MSHHHPPRTRGELHEPVQERESRHMHAGTYGVHLPCLQWALKHKVPQRLLRPRPMHVLPRPPLWSQPRLLCRWRPGSLPAASSSVLYA